jgi:hypothetical protein
VGRQKHHDVSLTDHLIVVGEQLFQDGDRIALESR